MPLGASCSIGQGRRALRSVGQAMRLACIIAQAQDSYSEFESDTEENSPAELWYDNLRRNPMRLVKERQHLGKKRMT